MPERLHCLRQCHDGLHSFGLQNHCMSKQIFALHHSSGCPLVSLCVRRQQQGTPRVCHCRFPRQVTSPSRTSDAVRTPSAVRHVGRLMLPQFLLATLGCPGWPLPGIVRSVCFLPLRMCLRGRLVDLWCGHLRRLQFPHLQHISYFVSYLLYCCSCFAPVDPSTP